MIKIYDDFITPEKCVQFYRYCKQISYFHGETDTEKTPPVGLISELEPDNEWREFFIEQIKNKCLIDHKVTRSYINLFLPGENPYYHVDGSNKETTFLYYSNLEWNLNQGGETKFVIDDEVKGILPIPNRAIIFSADIIHSASSFRTNPRYTLAIKYSPTK